MIRALIGRFVEHCIEQNRTRRMAVEVRRIDPSKMTDQQISEWVHGRPIDWSQTGCTRIDHRGRAI